MLAWIMFYVIGTIVFSTLVLRPFSESVYSACVFQRLWNGFQISSQNRWVASSNSVGVNVVTGFVFLFFCFRLDNRSIMHSCIFAPRLDIMRASCFPIALKVPMLLRHSQHCCYLQLAVLTNVIFAQCDLHLV